MNPPDVDALARIMMGGGDPCEGSVSDAEEILERLPNLLRSASPAGYALRERLGLSWAYEEGTFDAYGWMGTWMTSPEERTHRRRWLVSTSTTEPLPDPT